jgi:twitching motility protein PilT
MNHNQALDLITSFFDEEVIEGLKAMKELALSEDMDIISDLVNHENQSVRKLALEVLENLKNQKHLNKETIPVNKTFPHNEIPKRSALSDIKFPKAVNSQIQPDKPVFKTPETVKKKEDLNLSKVDNFLEEMTKPVELPDVNSRALSSRKVLLPRNMRTKETPNLTAGILESKNTEDIKDTKNIKNSENISENIKDTVLPVNNPFDNTDKIIDIPSLKPKINPIKTSSQPHVHDTPLEGILLDAIERGASDIHLFTGYPPILRIHGDILFENLMPLSSSLIKEAAVAVLGDLEYRRFVDEMELDIAYHIEGKARFRVNVFNDINGIAMIFRHIPDKVPSIEKLKLPPVLKEICNERKGLILVTGATGSGKSTTIAAMIDWVNRNRKAHILTIEDPVEFVHKPKLSKITHRQVKQNTKSFNSALKNALRQDPDVILIGEMRDLESVTIALHAAETGHLVFGSLHTKSAARTVSRLIGIFPPREQEHIRNQIADGLKGVICQSLIKKSDGTGRVPAFEILRPNSAIANLIRKNNTSQINDAIRSGKSKGMISLISSIAKLIKKGEVTLEDSLPYLSCHEDEDELRSLLK